MKWQFTRCCLGFATLSLALSLTACGPLPSRGGIAGPAPDGRPLVRLDPDSIADAVPRWEPYSKSGNMPSYQVLGRNYQVMAAGDGYVERGVASWYGTKFHGRSTSNGEPYDVYAMTAAHKSLPLPSYVEVVNLDNGRKAVVRVNDRGPFHEDRLIDLSYAAAVKLGIADSGVGRVEVRAITTNPAVLARQPAVTTPPVAMTLPVAEANGVYLQLGLFSNRDNLQRMQAKLQQAKIERVTVRQESAGNGAMVFRLRIGPLPDRSQAERLAIQLGTLGISQTYIVD